MKRRTFFGALAAFVGLAPGIKAEPPKPQYDQILVRGNIGIIAGEFIPHGMMVFVGDDGKAYISGGANDKRTSTGKTLSNIVFWS